LIRTRRGLLLIAGLTFIIALLVLFPARIAYKWAAPADIRLSGIEGSIWHGSADALEAGGIFLRDVKWASRPWYLLTGRLMYRIEASPINGFLEGDLFASIGRSVTVSGSNVRSSLPLKMFASPLRVRGLQGNASLQLERFELKDGVPVKLDGVVDVANLLVPAIDRASIGGYRAEFFTQVDGITASIEDTDGLLDVAGSVQLKSDRSYQLIAKVMAKPAAPAGLRNQLRMLPPASDGGPQELRVEGSL
jgi:hypothetical protein